MSVLHSLRQLDPQGRRIHVAHLPAFDVPLELGLSSPFVLVVAAEAAQVSANTIGILADAVVKQGAVYAVCWGPRCELVEEVFDWAWIAYEQYYYFPDDTVLITTSHPRDTLAEALWFAFYSATPTEPFAGSCKDVVVLSVGRIAAQNLEGTIIQVLAGAA